MSDNNDYQLGNTKIFFRAGQLGYLERLRSKRRFQCTVNIQKHFKGWIQRTKWLCIKRAIRVIQTAIRRLLVRRQLQIKQQAHAATILQKNVRMWSARAMFKSKRHSALLIQTVYRGHTARKAKKIHTQNNHAIILQSYYRQWAQRKLYLKTIECVIVIQCKFKCYSAKKELKRLRLVAKSIAFQQTKIISLENNITVLQQDLNESKQRE
jgi:myosin-5